MSPSTGPAKETQSWNRNFLVDDPRSFYLVVVCPEMKALWQLHAVILIDSPEMAVVGFLAQTLTDGSIEVVLADDVVLGKVAAGYSHFPAWVITKGDHGVQEEGYDQHG